MNYVLVEVSVHNLEAKTPEEVRKQIDKVLREHFKPDYDVDIEVVLVESA